MRWSWFDVVLYVIAFVLLVPLITRFAQLICRALYP
jgi:hypothetical protein